MIRIIIWFNALLNSDAIQNKMKRQVVKNLSLFILFIDNIQGCGNMDEEVYIDDIYELKDLLGNNFDKCLEGIDKDSDISKYFSEEYNNYSMIDVYNTSDNDDYAINGYVGGIKLDYEEAGAPSFEWRGITEQSSEDDVYAALGNPDDKEDYDDSVEITYYGGSGWVSFSFTPDGKMIDFWLSNYEALD